MKMRNYWVSLALLITVVGCAVANDYYTHGSFPSPGSPATSAAMRAELDLITTGFDKLPTFSGNASKAVIINGSANALSTTTGTLTLAGNFAISGAYATTLTVTGATGVTLPTTGTLATLAGSETLTNKTLNLTSNTLTGTVAQFNTALSDDNFVTLTGTETLTNKTLTSPVLTTPSFSGNVSTNLPISTASLPKLILSTTAAGNRTSMIDFQKAGTSKWVLAADFAQADLQEFYIYDSENNRYPFTILSDGTVSITQGARIDGLLNLSAGASASQGQIKFPATQVPSADTNTLDDYEEGAWTPSVGGSATYTTQAGRYVKIGGQVTVWGTVIINSIGTGDTVIVSGLPFAVRAGTVTAVGAAYALLSATNTVDLVAVAVSGSSTLSLGSKTAAAASQSFASPIFQNSTSVFFTLTYPAS